MYFSCFVKSIRKKNSLIVLIRFNIVLLVRFHLFLFYFFFFCTLVGDDTVQNMNKRIFTYDGKDSIELD